MNWKIIVWELMLVSFLFSCTDPGKVGVNDDQQVNYDYLKSHFQQPEQVYGVNCWWWWLN